MKECSKIVIGGLELVEVSYLCKIFGLTRRVALKWLRELNITTLHITDEAYYAPEAFEITLRVIIESGEVFAFPGSRKKEKDHRRRGLIKLTDKMKKRVCTVQTRVTDNFNFNEEVKQWQREKQELKLARKELVKLRNVLHRV